MKTIVLVLAMVLTATMAMATEQCPPPPCPECQPVQVTCNCSDTPQRPMEVDGFWKGPVRGGIRCGTMLFFAGNWFEFRDLETGQKFLITTEARSLRNVDGCE